MFDLQFVILINVPNSFSIPLKKVYLLKNLPLEVSIPQIVYNTIVVKGTYRKTSG